MSSKLVPKVRFKEFSGEWEEKRLGDIGELISGLTYSPDDVRDSGLLVLRSSNVQESKITLDDIVYVRTDIKGANLSKPNDILICVRNGSKALIGKNALIPNNMPLCTHGAFMTIFRSEISKFTYQLFQTNFYTKQVEADLGATINSINGNLLKKYIFYIPKPQEQQKIADTFSSLDNLIEVQTKKVELLKSHKKGLMQKLFPRDGAKVPEVRFKEFSGEWEEKPFELVFDRIPSKKYQITSKEYLKKGTYPVIDQGKQKIVGYSNEHIKVFKNDSVIVFGDHTRIFKYIDFNFIVGADGTQLIKTKQNFDNKFFYYQLLTKEIPNTGYNRHFKFIKDIIFKISPTPQEQQKIANTLSSLDNLIEAQTKKIELLKEHKKGLMQKMFVGDK